jgi:hypothetical protein
VPFTNGMSAVGSSDSGDEADELTLKHMDDARDQRIAIVSSRHAIMVGGSGGADGGGLRMGTQVPSRCCRTELQQLQCSKGECGGYEWEGAMDRETWGGDGKSGRLGNGDEADQPAPKRVDALRDECAVAVTCGKRHAIAVVRGGGVVGWDYVGGLGIPEAAANMRYDWWRGGFGGWTG